jgi:hypothetical protein
MSDVYDEEQRFRAAVPASMVAVNAFADYLRRRRWTEVEVSAVTVRPRLEERGGYGDREDVRGVSPNGARRRFEIKGRTIVFTCRDDFPFPTVWVESVSKRNEWADWYVTVSKDLQYAALTEGAHHDQWKVETVRLFGYGGYFHKPLYACPVELMQFIKIG